MREAPSSKRKSSIELQKELNEKNHLISSLEEKLSQKQKKFKETFDNAAIGLAYLSLDGRWTRVNLAMCEILGYSASELLEMNFREVTHPDDLPEDLDQLRLLFEGAQSRYALEKRYIRKNGQVIWSKLNVALVRHDTGEPDFLVTVVENIDDRKRAENELALAKRRDDIVFEAARLGVFDFFGEGDPRNYWSNWVRKHFGIDQYSPLDYARFVKLIHPEDWPALEKTLSHCMAVPDSRYHVEYRVIGEQDHQLRWIEASGQSFFDDKEKAIRLCGTTFDITDRKTAEAQALRAELHDPLTGLPNRILLFEYSAHIFDNAARHGHAGAVLFIDLDRFKQVNDLLGHGVGDQLLIKVVERIRSCLRSGDLVFRLAGDEFVVLLPEIGRESESAQIAERLVTAIAVPYPLDHAEVRISASIGIALFPSDGKDIQQLVQAGDSAMYLAKQSGKNTWRFFSHTLSRAVRETIELQNRIRGALERMEFELYYQPILDLSIRRICSVEALLRWPVANIGPDKFIPAAEVVGQIVPIGQWVIEEACKTQRQWLDRGMDLVPIAVNVSALQFRHKDFRSKLLSRLHENDLSPSALQLELTESSVLEDLPHAISLLGQLRSDGIKISLDDFGTGYSSLSHIARLPVDKVKIDKSFVQCSSSNEASRAVTEAIVAIARRLKLEIVAEGVESQGMLRDMQSLGCGQMQGYLIARPMTADVFCEAMKAGLSSFIDESMLTPD